jgi:hypothetical protein
MKTIILGTLFLLTPAMANPMPQQNTDLPGAGPCTNFPTRYRKVEERLAWFYGCMHKEPPTVTQIQTKIAALPPDKRSLLKPNNFANNEALIGVAAGELPIQVFPK